MSSEQPLHVVIRVPYKRPPGFVEPPSIIWTDGMEQRLWEILTQSKRQNIDWNAASRELNVPVPYLLRHAAFLYETQLRGVQIQLRRGEALSSSNISGSHGNRNRASSLVDTGSPKQLRPLSTSSSVSTITTIDPVSRQPAQMTPKQEAFPATNLSTIESSTTTSFATPAASLTMPLSRTLSNSSSPNAQHLSRSVFVHTANPDNDYTDEFLEERGDNLKQSNEFSLSDKLARLKVQDGPAFLPGSHHDIGFKIVPELSDLMGIRVPITYSAPNSQLLNRPEKLQPYNKGESSVNDSNSQSSISDLGSMTQSEIERLESAILEDASNSKLSVYSSRKNSQYQGS